ncbi:SRPBCC family protein [Nocardioides caeni]|uniref:Polyketide cyclase n=1 Tax=Nocardioides caeni TaxID=574700 RepID=A0A4V4HLE5_9ACTN|nr:SRPBCC family protein [Nocardioides caeni]THV17936.1 polyketide cyclase [Nocardioides caeni]
MARAYEFADTWEVAASVDEVAGVLTDLEHYPRWWPQVRAVAKLGPDTAWVRCRSTLPYTLDLVLDAVSREAPVVEVALSGDLEGFARFTLTAEDDGTRLDFAQEVTVRGRLALASYVLRPVLEWNHRRMMTGCRTGLTEWLSQRRRAASPRTSSRT